MLSTFNVYLWDPYLLLDIVVLLGFICGLFVITSNNPMHSILYLIGLFVSVSGYLYYIGLGIMSLLYLLIYVGAIAILFLFILSLLDIQLAELQVKSNVNDLPLVVLVISIFYYSFYKFYNTGISFININELFDYKMSSKYSDILDINSINYVYNESKELPNSLYNIINHNWYGMSPINDLTSIGNLLYTEYSVLFIMLAVILLLSIVGAIVVTTLKKQ